MNNPVSTYRLQFHKQFSFQDFEGLIPYFRKLGVGTIYASPILESTSGSTHGYDGINPGRINPEIGSLERLRALSSVLREDGIGWLQDIVPNHMAFHPENPWLMDVLEKGMQSVYAGYFDIAWNSRLFHGKLMVPFLAKDLDEVIAAGGVSIRCADGRFVLGYEGLVFPLNPKSYTSILEKVNGDQAMQQLLAQLDDLRVVEEATAFSQQWGEWLLQFKAMLNSQQVIASVEQALTSINADKDRLKSIIDQQHYVLSHWQKTEEQINFRRFFTVNGLICLNMQDEDVFEQYHQLIGQLVEEGIFQGLRIDHIDGLYGPQAYLTKLRNQVGPDTYIVVEKILEENEALPAEWPLEGTTGYEFLGLINNLLTNRGAEHSFDTFYKDLTGEERSVHEQLISKKSEILFGHMGGELENLYQLFVELELVDADTLVRIGPEPLRDVIGQFLIHCPVYRYYASAMPLPDAEAQAVKNILLEVSKHHLHLSPAVEVLEQCFIHRPVLQDQAYNRRASEFYRRCMQFTGPLMAKGGEDTLMYTNNRFIAHSEVGDFPDRFGLLAKYFHVAMRRRQKEWPLTLNATSTHDTKRGEDVRARLNVLTDLADEWFVAVKEWQGLYATTKKEGTGPDANDEYLIYQALLGAYPMEPEYEAGFAERLKNYIQKALREAKTHSSWSSPNEIYETQVQEFAENLLKPDSRFIVSFKRFLDSIVDFGMINSLVQQALKFTCPGVPDVYQGSELWDLSLVDPDNRRRVDYGKRKMWLDEFEDYEPERLLEKLWNERRNGAIKLWLTAQLFHLRRLYPMLFEKGEYLPLTVRGAYKANLFAFARRHKKEFCVIVVPLHVAVICREQEKDFFELDWKDTCVVLPDNLEAGWEDLFTGVSAEYVGKLLPTKIFEKLPLAILKGSKLDNERSAGILLHVSSLASPYGIGDLGPEAFAFADFLESANQRIWQILPLNPTEKAQANSPYSALSSRAGNPLFISPDVLADQGWLPRESLSNYHSEPRPQTDYEAVAEAKRRMLKGAFENYNKATPQREDVNFEEFISRNSEWLQDFGLYIVLKEQFGGKPWYEWPEEYKTRETGAIQGIKAQKAEQIRFIQWQQYLFDLQWKRLRAYCNERDISLVGDIPFYVSHDSADVWANRDLFCVTKDGKLTGIAGVPPDAFSEEGQLWGMPVFNWTALKEQQYQWWIDRLAKNIELFDMVRLDHFRAFVDYWEVPGGEHTAVNGSWQTGPGADFFEKIKAALGELPFIAEDLGEITPEVYHLRDQFAFPGMKVLQFAFDEHMPQSEYIPHNYSQNFFAYTGTHDNNTTIGWFEQMAADGVQTRLEEYLGKPVTTENLNAEMARSIYGSVAKAAILPVQDVLNLGEEAKMNLPGSSENNWSWRLLPGQLTKDHAKFLADLTILFNRD